jgi:molybdopterin/thiamine biosynthesis adenylyltransferase
LFLSQFLNSLKRESVIYLVDGDRFELRNNGRMLFGHIANKAVEKAEELSKKFGDYIRYYPVPHYITDDNIAGIIDEGDLVFLCVDNHATRLLVNKRCGELRSTILISGGNDGVEDGKDGTFGNVQIFIRCDGRNVTNPLTRFHPEIEHPSDRRPDELSCGELIQSSAPQLLFTNLAVASAMLNTFFCCLCDELKYEELYMSISRGKMVPVKRGTEV